MANFEHLAESRIREAIDRGDFKDLPLLGKPLPPDDLDGVPAELRLAYSMLKNAGCLPEELALHQDIRNLRDLIGLCEDEDLLEELGEQLLAKELRFNMLMEQRKMSRLPRRYRARLRERLGF